MDEQVLRAMARWPDVPAVHGWLRLGARAAWYLIDRGAPDFDPHRDAGGSPITSPPILAFINRNYQADADGAWYWQNGPQRCYARLDLAPLIFRIVGADDGSPLGLLAHTGRIARAVDALCCDEDGNLHVLTDLGAGAIDDRDLARLDPKLDDDGTVLLLDFRGGILRKVDAGKPRQRQAIATDWGFVANPVPNPMPNPVPD